MRPAYGRRAVPHQGGAVAFYELTIGECEACSIEREQEDAQMTGISEHNDNLVAATLAAAIVHRSTFSNQLPKDAAFAVAVYFEVQKQLKARKEDKSP